MKKAVRRINTISHKQPCFGGDVVQLSQILTQEKMKSPPILFRFVFREDPQQVAVVKIQRPKPCDFAGLFQAAEQANPYDLTGRFGRFLFSSCLRQNPSADLFNGIVLTEIPYQPYKAFLARRPYRNILADLDYGQEIRLRKLGIY